MKSLKLRFPKIHYLFVIFSFFSLSISALTVNRLNGGTNIIYIDFSIPTSTVPLELLRTYNSLTALNESNGWPGSFGWGWSSPFETTLNTTPEKNVILRDGITANNVIFRSQKSDPKVLEQFLVDLKRAYFEQKRSRKISKEELARLELPAKILTRLKKDIYFRAELAAKYNMPSQIPQGDVLTSNEYGFQTITFKNNQWIREKEGLTQIFDKDGRLTRQIDKNNFYFDFKYSNLQHSQLSEIVDQDRSISLKFTWTGDRVTECNDSRGFKAKFNYDSLGNLTSVTDSNSHTYVYKYENKKFPHLMTKVEYLSEIKGSVKPFREIRYDDNGVASYHREKDGSETFYTYGRAPSDPENSFWTKSVRKNKGVTEEQYDEYLLKARADGTKYLYKQETKVGGVNTATVYTACCGKPSQISKNGDVTNFKYDEYGLLREKTGAKDYVKLEYDSRFRKVSKVDQNGVTSSYEYDKNGNLTKAANSKNEKVALKYDKLGRIIEMTDPEGKQISFQYGNQGKPILISQKGVGAIRIGYNPDGKIEKTETILTSQKGRKPSATQSQEVVRKVMRGFQHLLDILRPAGVSLAG